MFKGRFNGIAIAVMLILVLILLLACGDGDTNSETGLSRAEVEDIVRAELAGSPAPAQPGFSRAEVEQVMEAALQRIPEPEPGLSRTEVEQVMEAALQRIPEPEPGLTQAEMDEAIQTAIAAMPEPEPGLTTADAMRIAQYTAVAIPAKSSPADYTRFFVDNAISRYDTQGLDATLAHYNRAESVDGQWYVFIVDDDDKVIAHPDGSVIGLDLKGPLGTDANGYEFGPEMLSAAEDGRWVSYVYRNPETRSIGASFGELQLKNAWVVRHDGLLFGSGWYVDADEFAKSFVAAAVSKFSAVGLEGTVEYFTGSESDFAGLAAAIDYYNSIDTVEGKWSAFIADGSGTIVDHYDKSLVGTDLRDLFGVAMFEASEEGNWVTTESLRIWVVSYDGLVFGSGWHQDEPGS